jgi:hypothetical protein
LASGSIVTAKNTHSRTGIGAAIAGLLAAHLAACGATGDSGMVGLRPRPTSNAPTLRVTTSPPQNAAARPSTPVSFAIISSKV